MGGFVAGCCASILLACSFASATDKVKELQDHFDKDAHAGSKVKALEKLAEAQFAAADKAIQANDYVTAGLTYEKYRDNVRAAFALLKRQEPDADRHPGSYRQLELQVRKGIREVEEAQMVAPPELRPPLSLVRKDLIDIDDELIRLLFPRRSKDPEKSTTALGAGGKTMSLPACSKIHCAVFVLLAGLLGGAVVRAQRPEKDYLSSVEADKIRDAETPNERVKLFLSFAEDRLKKFQYELEHPSPTKHSEMLNYLMNSYSGCVDDAADIIQVSLSKQENIRQGIDLMASKTKEFLQILQKYASSGPELGVYKDNLDDAIEATQDAMNEAEKSKKKAAPPPVRRKN